MYHAISAFLGDWDYESSATLKFVRALTEPALAQSVGEGSRSLGRITWHTICAIADIGVSAGLDVAGPRDADTPVPATVAEMAAAYEAASGAFVAALNRQWTDAMLQDQVEMYGEHWERGKALTMLVMHQAHHRGQMSVLMRQAGLRVPDVYGPAKEDWAQWGMEAQS